jgi:hypothetical protein
MTSALLQIPFYPPLVAPAPIGLYGAVDWMQTGEPARWLASGVEIFPMNYGGESAVGVWEAPWCAQLEDLDVDDLKTGTRPDISDLQPFDPLTVYGFDQNPCGDMHEFIRQQTYERAQQNLALLEPITVETSFAARMLTDAPTPASAADVVAAVSQLEAELAKTNTIGVIHAGAQWASHMAAALIYDPDAGLTTPLGHRLVFGGGYVDALGSTLVATSPIFGWRSEAAVRDTIQYDYNQYVVVAERSVLVGYEKAIGAAVIT